MKIKPGKDINVLKEVREAFPHTPIMADANSAYTLDDLDHLKQLDQYNLMMIEQPLASDDIIDHATLQAQIETPICLDERSEEHTSELQSRGHLVCRLLLENKNNHN